MITTGMYVDKSLGNTNLHLKNPFKYTVDDISKSFNRIGSGEYVGEVVIDLATADLYEEPQVYMLHPHESGAGHQSARGDQVCLLNAM